MIKMLDQQYCCLSEYDLMSNSSDGTIKIQSCGITSFPFWKLSFCNSLFVPKRGWTMPLPDTGRAVREALRARSASYQRLGKHLAISFIFLPNILLRAEDIHTLILSAAVRKPF